MSTLKPVELDQRIRALNYRVRPEHIDILAARIAYDANDQTFSDDALLATLAEYERKMPKLFYSDPEFQFLSAARARTPPHRPKPVRKPKPKPQPRPKRKTERYLYGILVSHLD